MFLLVPAYPGCPGSKAVKRSLLLLLSLCSRCVSLILSVACCVNGIVISGGWFRVSETTGGRNTDRMWRAAAADCQEDVDNNARELFLSATIH